MSTEQAALALIDIYNNKSVYESITLIGNEEEAVVEKTEDTDFKSDSDSKEEIKDADSTNTNEDKLNKDKDIESQSKTNKKELVKTGSVIGFEALIAISVLLIISGIIVLKKQNKQSVI